MQFIKAKAQAEGGKYSYYFEVNHLLILRRYIIFHSKTSFVILVTDDRRILHDVSAKRSKERL